MTLTPHPLLVTWSRKRRAIPVLPLWLVQPVQRCNLPLPYSPVISSLLDPSTFLNTLSLHSSLKVRDQVLHPYKTYGKITVLCVCVCVCVCVYMCIYIYIYTHTQGVPDFGRVFFMFKYTDITQNTYIQS